MIPVEFPGSQTIGKPKDMTDEQCSSIPAGRGRDEAGFPFFLTAWKPSYEDLQALNNGQPIYVKVLSQRLPPMAIFTLDENQNANV